MNITTDLHFVNRALYAFHEACLGAQKPVINQQLLDDVIQSLDLQKWAKMEDFKEKN